MGKTVFYKNFPITLDKSGFRALREAFKNARAGGGLVRNSKGEYLLIFRHGQWDLPKGKLNKGEDIKTCAIREVEEETGISGLRIVRKLPKTYHLFTNASGNIVLKKCHWFEMETDDCRPPTPQLEEDITEAVWLSREEVEARKPLMFSTIRSCFDFYFSTTKVNFWKRLFLFRSK
jgi:8-oxo-dGTP pyrophosphatase MutT (NUDIX family)